MNTFIVPCNPKYYQVFNAFHELKIVDWKQSLNAVSVGDIVYIYVSAPISAICFKCKVKKVNKSERTIDDSQYVLWGDPYVPHKRHMELELVEEYDQSLLPISRLRKLGMVGKIQWTEKISEMLANKIEESSLNQDIILSTTNTSESQSYSEDEDKDKALKRRKEAVLASLRKVFPENKIYREQYNLNRIGVAIHHSIYKFAKAEGVPVSQWLELNGFHWQETGYIEEDMIAREGGIVATDAFTLADSVFQHFPLAGQYVPSATDMEKLYARAQKTVFQMVLEKAKISFQDEAVLTLSTILLLKNRKTSSLDDEGNEISFWNYIYLQYGFNSSNSEKVEQRVYKKFRDAIKNTLIHYGRYMAPPGTMRYYTSLMLHAISPRQSIENLLDILFDFYVKNLDFQYMPNDIGYKTLVKGIQSRWSEENKNTELKLKSAEIMSGLKILFQERPGYMAVLCDSLVMKMDLMLRGEDLSLEDEWDKRLVEWFKKKSRIERSSLQDEKRNHHTEYVATTSDRILLQYVIENEHVGFSIPRIRLSEVKDERPILTIFQDSREIYKEPLSVSGNDLGFTTRRTFIPFTETCFDFTGSCQLDATITYYGETLYSSGNKLYRKWLVFDEYGRERSPKKGIIYLFGTDITDFYFSDEESITQENHPGQFFRINLNSVLSISADGAEIFADDTQIERIRVYPTVNPIKGLSVFVEGREYQLFEHPLSLVIHLPKDANKLQYQYLINGKRYIEQNNISQNQVKIEIPVVPYETNSLDIIDFKQNTISYEFNYIIVPGFSYRWEKPYYLSSESDAAIMISQDNNEERIVFQRTGEDDTSISSQPFKGMFFSADIPTLKCFYNEVDAFHISKQMWSGDIEKDTSITISSPNSCRGQLMLGTQPLPQNTRGEYEIGNYLRSGKKFSDIESLWVSVTSADHQIDHHLITTIYSKPAFLENPIEIDQNKILWLPEHKFIGSHSSSFIVKINGETDYQFKLNGHNLDKPLVDNTPHGRYHIDVAQISSGIFSKEKETVVYEAYFFVGDEKELQFKGKELILSSAIYWNEKKQEIDTSIMRPSSGILTNLIYLGDQVRPWDDLPLPKYKATLCYENAEGMRIPFNFNKENKDFEWINPVFIWIVNEQKLILCTAEEEVIYFDSGYCSIVNRNPDKTMTATARMNRLKNPDYFEYEEKEVINGV